jgi:hypothetical protein
MTNINSPGRLWGRSQFRESPDTWSSHGTRSKSSQSGSLSIKRIQRSIGDGIVEEGSSPGVNKRTLDAKKSEKRALGNKGQKPRSLKWFQGVQALRIATAFSATPKRKLSKKSWLLYQKEGKCGRGGPRVPFAGAVKLAIQSPSCVNVLLTPNPRGSIFECEKSNIQTPSKA